MKTCKLMALYFTLLMLCGCGNSGDNSAGQSQQIAPIITSNGTAPSKGIFSDSPVAGITYRTASLTGITNAAGEFQYYPGETVTFSIGDVILGSAPAQSKLTPIELSADRNDRNPTTINICRFLQSLDSDNNLDNGIQITPEIRAEMAGKNIDFSKNTVDFNDSVMQALFASLNSKGVFTDGSDRELLSDLAAQYNLRHYLHPSENPFDGVWETEFQYPETTGSSGTVFTIGEDGMLMPPDIAESGIAKVIIEGSKVTFVPSAGASAVVGTISDSGQIVIPDRIVSCNNGVGGQLALSSGFILNIDGSLIGKWQIGLPSPATGNCYPYSIKTVFHPAVLFPTPVH